MPIVVDAILLLQQPMTWVVTVFGLIFGSFFNVCIYRIPEKTFFKRARSACRNCGALIPWYLNIPLVSFLGLRGKAACCQAKISWQYPLVELGTAALFVTLYWRYPFVTMYPGYFGLDNQNALRFLYMVVFTGALIIASVIDLHHMIIPDVLSLSLLTMTPIAVMVHPDLDWQSSLYGVLLGGGVLYGIAWGYWLVRREIGMGMGDVKLLAAIGGWLGVQAIIPTVFYGSLLGSAVGIIILLLSRRYNLKSQMPFGPFLSLGAIIHILFGSQLSQTLFQWTN